MPPELLVELVQQCGQDLESFLHDRESAVLIVSMVDTAVAITTHLGRGGGGRGEEREERREGAGERMRRGGEGGRGRRRERARERKEEGGSKEGKELVTYYKPAVYHVDPPVRQTLPAGDLRPVGGCQ